MVANLEPLRIAIGQPAMHWSTADNMAAILRMTEQAAAEGVQLCVFPELAVTGFHRKIAALAQPALVDPWLEAMGATCARRGIAVALGAPTFGDDGRIFNSHLYFDAHGRRVGAVDKSGLTPAEATFFAPGAARSVLSLLGRRCTSVICREVEDLPQLAAQLVDRPVQLVLWPGAMRPAVDGSQADPERHFKHAAALARHFATHVVQANWPNALNYPEESAQMGNSVVIDPHGRELIRLPQAQAGMAVFALGEHGFTWLVH